MVVPLVRECFGISAGFSFLKFLVCMVEVSLCPSLLVCTGVGEFDSSLLRSRMNYSDQSLNCWTICGYVLAISNVLLDTAQVLQRWLRGRPAGVLYSSYDAGGGDNYDCDFGVVNSDDGCGNGYDDGERGRCADDGDQALLPQATFVTACPCMNICWSNLL